MIRFSIPETLPTVNVLMRMHWAKRLKLSNRVQKLTYAALIESGWRPSDGLIKRCVIRIKRYSSNEPDPDGMRTTAKLLLDVLQPVSKRCPRGLGVIADDCSVCLTSLTVEHVPKRVARMDVEIEPI